MQKKVVAHLLHKCREIKPQLWHDLGPSHIKLPSDWLGSDTAFPGPVVCWTASETCLRFANRRVQRQDTIERMACMFLYMCTRVSLTVT